MRKTNSLFNSSNPILSMTLLCNKNNLSEVLSIRFFHGTLWLKEFHEVNALNFWKTKRYTLNFEILLRQVYQERYFQNKKTTHKTKREDGLENCFKCSILFIDIMISLHFSGDEGYRIRHTQLTFSKAYFHKNGHMMLFYVLVFSGEGRMWIPGLNRRMFWAQINLLLITLFIYEQFTLSPRMTKFIPPLPLKYGRFCYAN